MVVAVVALIFAFKSGLDKSEIVTCNKYQAYAQEFPDFWVTEADWNMCVEHGISLDSLIYSPDSEETNAEKNI